MDYEKYPRESATFDNVAPDMVHAYRQMCKYLDVDSGDYLTKLFRETVIKECGKGALEVFHTGYQRTLSPGE